MSYNRNNAIAITWNARECHAVQVKAAGGSCEIAAAWHGCVGTDGASLAELLAAGLRAVGADDSIHIVAGGNEHGWGMADLHMPPLKGDELRNALAFELQKHTPLPADKLCWGYRVIDCGNAAKSIPQHIRLFYMRSESRDSSLKAVAAFHHIDAMLPPPVALDPLLKGRTVTLQGEDGTMLEYRSGEEGRLAGTAACSSDSPPALEAMLAMGASLRPGALAGRPAAEQAGFASAVVLGMYGLGDCIGRDAATLIPLPERLHANRNVALKMSAAVLGFYLLGLLIFILSSSFQQKSVQIRRVEKEIAQTRRTLEGLRGYMDPKSAERCDALRQELLANAAAGPDLPTALAALTAIIPENAWLSQNLEWKNGNVTFQTQSPTKILDLAARLEESPVLGDVGERLSTFNQSANAFTQRFELTARYDTPQETAALKLARAAEAARRQDGPEPDDGGNSGEPDSTAEDGPETDEDGDAEENGEEGE